MLFPSPCRKGDLQTALSSNALPKTEKTKCFAAKLKGIKKLRNKKTQTQTFCGYIERKYCKWHLWLHNKMIEDGIKQMSSNANFEHFIPHFSGLKVVFCVVVSQIAQWNGKQCRP